MARKHLLVVHGMGQHTDESVKAEVADAFTTAFSRYASLKDKKVADLMEIVPVSYAEIFDTFRQQRATSNEGLSEWLAGINGMQSLPLQAVAEVNDLEASLAEDTFFNTHWLDVLLYRFTFLSERVRLKVAAAIGKSIVDAQGSTNVHVLGHSLGTAVLHDTLAKAYGPENIELDGKAINLNSVSDRLAGIHMVANVSRALQSFVAVGSSIVRPGPLGCAGVFAEYRHRLDPIPMIRQFNPTNNGEWVPQTIFTSVYSLREPTSVTEANVHGLGHYLLTPEVHQLLFRLLFNFAPKKAEKAAGEAAYLATTVLGKAKALQAAFGDLGGAASEESVTKLLKTAKALKDMVQGFGEQF